MHYSYEDVETFIQEENVKFQQNGTVILLS